MSPHNDDHTDNEAFDAFLKREGNLSKKLQELPQPMPSVALSEKIMAHAESVLGHLSPANDMLNSDARVHWILRGFKHQVSVPLALAATVLVAVTIGFLWQNQSPDLGPMVVAHAPQLPAVPSQARNAPAEPAATTSVAVPPTLIAQADLPEAARKSIIARPAPSTPSTILSASGIPSAPPVQIDSSPAATTAIPPGSDTISGSNVEPKAWLAMIDELIKADLKRDALDEWAKFRKAYPNYPVPDKLDAKINMLKK